MICSFPVFRSVLLVAILFCSGCATNRVFLDLSATSAGESIDVFDGKSFGSWKPLKKAEFELPGPVKVKKGVVSVGKGNSFSGLSWGGAVPRSNYEFELSARRVEGDDIFCGIFFPVGTNNCSMILGGWGNSIVGLSSINTAAAAENETAVFMQFDNDKWYNVRLRVTNKRIEGWIDEKRVINLELLDRSISAYPGLEIFEPFGVFTWETGAEVRDMVFTRLQK